MNTMVRPSSLDLKWLDVATFIGKFGFSHRNQQQKVLKL